MGDFGEKYQEPSKWSREGATFMTAHTIDNMLRSAQIPMVCHELVPHGVVWRTDMTTNGNQRLWGVHGGIGAFIEDARALYSKLALDADPVLD